MLLAYGREGLADMFARQVRLARGISKFLSESDDFELLPTGSHQHGSFEDVYIIAIFRAKDENLNEDLIKKVNATRKIQVTGTKWEGKPACRIAVSTWKVEVERDLKLVKEVLEEVSK